MKHKARGGRNFREICLAESKFDCEKFAFVSKEILASPKRAPIPVGEGFAVRKEEHRYGELGTATGGEAPRRRRNLVLLD